MIKLVIFKALSIKKLRCCCLPSSSSLPPSLVVSVSDFGVGSEGESLLSGLVHSEEGQQAEESGDQLGAEERGVHQTRQPTEEGPRTVFFVCFCFFLSCAEIG